MGPNKNGFWPEKQDGDDLVLTTFWSIQIWILVNREAINSYQNTYVETLGFFLYKYFSINCLNYLLNLTIYLIEKALTKLSIEHKKPQRITLLLQMLYTV